MGSLFGRINSNKNNNQNNGVNKVNPWAKPANNNTNNGQQGQQQQQTGQQQQNGNQQTQSQQFDVTDYFRKQGLFANVNGQQFKQILAEGTPEDVQAMFETMLTDAASVALQAATKVANARVDKALAEAKDVFQNDTRMSMTAQQMKEELAFTADEAIAPVAEMVLKQFLSLPNATPKSAIENVKKYFEQIAQATGAKLEGQQNGKPNQNNNNEDDAQSSTDFIDFLSGGRQTTDSVNNAINGTVQSQQGGKNNDTGEVDLSALQS